MLFLSYWELNENITPKDVVELAAKLMEKGLWPAEGTEILGFYTTTEVPIWGITIEEAESVESILKGAAVWTNEKPGFFKVLRVSPAMPAEEAIRIVTGM
jgi:hypothetical protein